MANSNIAGYDIEKDPFAPSLIHEITPESVASISATASVDNTSGNPGVTVTRTVSQDHNYNFDFEFTGLKGEQGERGLQGVPGPQGVRGLQGEQGQQGNIGPTGATGATGVGIQSIDYIGDDGDGNAIYRITLSNASTYNFTAYRGPQGPRGAQGLPGTGEDGVGISDISYASTDIDGNNIYVVTLSNGQTYSFTANRGPQGLPGNDGANGVTPEITATATVDGTSGTPAVQVTKTGSDEAPTFLFAFTGLKGTPGQGGTAVTLIDRNDVIFDKSNNNGTDQTLTARIGQMYEIGSKLPEFNIMTGSNNYVEFTTTEIIPAGSVLKLICPGMSASSGVTVTGTPTTCDYIGVLPFMKYDVEIVDTNNSRVASAPVNVINRGSTIGNTTGGNTYIRYEFPSVIEIPVTSNIPIGTYRLKFTKYIYSTMLITGWPTAVSPTADIVFPGYTDQTYFNKLILEY